MTGKTRRRTSRIDVSQVVLFRNCVSRSGLSVWLAPTPLPLSTALAIVGSLLQQLNNRKLRRQPFCLGYRGRDSVPWSGSTYPHTSTQCRQKRCTVRVKVRISNRQRQKTAALHLNWTFFGAGGFDGCGRETQSSVGVWSGADAWQWWRRCAQTFCCSLVRGLIRRRRC